MLLDLAGSQRLANAPVKSFLIYINRARSTSLLSAAVLASRLYAYRLPAVGWSAQTYRRIADEDEDAAKVTRVVPSKPRSFFVLPESR